jgi:hypothetical protein
MLPHDGQDASGSVSPERKSYASFDSTMHSTGMTYSESMQVSPKRMFGGFKWGAGAASKGSPGPTQPSEGAQVSGPSIKVAA